jgi:hypothetical protein
MVMYDQAKDNFVVSTLAFCGDKMRKRRKKLVIVACACAEMFASRCWTLMLISVEPEMRFVCFSAAQHLLS